jgi:hypothetical protein
MNNNYIEDGCPKCDSELEYRGSEENEYGNPNNNFWKCTNKDCKTIFKSETIEVITEEI